jgi:hypothetical protein
MGGGSITGGGGGVGARERARGVEWQVVRDSLRRRTKRRRRRSSWWWRRRRSDEGGGVPERRPAIAEEGELREDLRLGGAISEEGESYALLV